MEEHLIAVIAGMFLSAFALLVAWRFRFFEFPHHIENKAKMPFKAVFGAFLLYLITELLIVPTIIVIVWYSIYQPISIYEIEGAFDLTARALINLGSLVLVMIILVLYTYALKPTLRNLIWNPADKKSSQLVRDFIVGLGTWFVSFPVVLTVENLLVLVTSYIFPEFTKQIDQVAVKYLKALSETPVLFWSTAFVLCTFVPIIEELLFRGFLQTWLKRWLGPTKAILCASLFFALMHFSTSQSLANINLLCALFVLSCFLGFLYERQRSLWAPIGLHATFNTISILSFQ